jgi:hypothetical protein
MEGPSCRACCLQSDQCNSDILCMPTINALEAGAVTMVWASSTQTRWQHQQPLTLQAIAVAVGEWDDTTQEQALLRVMPFMQRTLGLHACANRQTQLGSRASA